MKVKIYNNKNNNLFHHIFFRVNDKINVQWQLAIFLVIQCGPPLLRKTSWFAPSLQWVFYIIILDIIIFLFEKISYFVLSPLFGWAHISNCIGIWRSNYINRSCFVKYFFTSLMALSAIFTFDIALATCLSNFNFESKTTPILSEGSFLGIF